MAGSGDDDYGREKPKTVDFYHGTSAAFDSFRQDKVLLEGANGASENGRGTYFTDDRQRADGWSGRNGSNASVTIRIAVDENTVQNSFIPHEKIFSKDDLINLAVHASLAGHHRTAESFVQLSRHEKPVTGQDIATRSKYDAGVNQVLAGQGFKGFTYSDENYKNEKIGNIVFFDTKDIPSAVPVLATTYTPLIKLGQDVPESTVPQALKEATEKMQQAIGERGRTLGISSDKITAAQENVGLLARAAAGMGEYDTGSTIHPLKYAEIGVVVGTETLDLARALRKETSEFITTGMQALGHELKPQVFEAKPAAISSPKDDSRYKDDRVTQLFHEYLQDPKFGIASEELRSGRSAVLQKDPSAQEKLDAIIMRLHSPELGGSDGFSMRNSFGVGLKDLARGEITPQELVQKMEKAAYFANVDLKQSMGMGSLAQGIESLAQKIATAPVATPATTPVAKPQAVR